jgi:hypothetical protein
MWLVACHARPSGAPLLTSVTPTAVTLTGGVVAMVTVRGRGFDSLNTVHFGRLRVPADDAFLPGRGGAPVLPLAPGTYDLRVENASGISNALAVTVTAAQGAR